MEKERKRGSSMEKRWKMMLFEMLLASTAAAGQYIPPCVTAIRYPCDDYLTLNKQPSPECCTAFAAIVDDQLPCTCSMLMSTDSPFVGTINVTRAMALPASCRIEFASKNCFSIGILGQGQSDLSWTYRLSSSEGDAQSSLPPAAAAETSSGGSKMSHAMIVGIVMASISLFFLLAAAIALTIYRARRKPATFDRIQSINMGRRVKGRSVEQMDEDLQTVWDELRQTKRQMKQMQKSHNMDIDALKVQIKELQTELQTLRSRS